MSARTQELYSLQALFVVPFLVPSSVRLDSLGFFLFLEVGLWCYEFPSRTAFAVSHRRLGGFSFSFVCVSFDFFLNLMAN